MSNIIGAEPWVLDIMENGLKPEFKQAPPSHYEERKGNNQKAKKNMEFLRSKVNEWVTEGHVKELTFKPNHIHPMTVAEKTDITTNITKRRPCIDLSRNLNKYVTKTKVKLDNLYICEKSLQKDNFMCVFDLSNMFFHGRLHTTPSSSSEFFNFSIPDEEGNPAYFRFLVMCYAYSQAGRIVTRLIAPLKAWLHTLGIRLHIYLDVAGSVPRVSTNVITRINWYYSSSNSRDGISNGRKLQSPPPDV